MGLGPARPGSVEAGTGTGRVVAFDDLAAGCSPAAPVARLEVITAAATDGEAAGEEPGPLEIAKLSRARVADLGADIQRREGRDTREGGGRVADVAVADAAIDAAALEGSGGRAARRSNRATQARTGRSHGGAGVADDTDVAGGGADGARPSAGAAGDGPDGELGGAGGRRAATGRGGRVGRERAHLAADGDEVGPDADPESVARAICLRLLTDRARTRQELAQALRRKGVPDDAARAVLERFDDVGLIDDNAFAEQWVRSRHTHRGLGRRALAVELRRKGVAEDVAAQALGGIDGESEERRARELVERKLRGLRTDTDEHRAVAGRRLVGMLARKGYGGGVAYRVVREALATRGLELDELASEPAADD